jgi:hypothetical protein
MFARGGRASVPRMSPLRRSRGAPCGSLALATALIVAVAATLTGCGGSPAGPRPRPSGRVAVPTPDLCEKLDRKLVERVLGGDVESCESTPRPPIEYRVTFGGKPEKTPDGRSAAARVTVTYWLRYHPKTGYDGWQSMNSTDDKRRVKLLSVGQDAVYDYGVPSLAAVTEDVIVSVAPEPATPGGRPGGDKLPERLTDIAAEAIAQAG